MNEIRTHTATVVRVDQLTPRMIRVTFSVPDYAGTGHADEWVPIFFGEPGDHRQRRNYTARAIRPDAGEVDVDFVVHEHGLAVDWVRSATPGQQLQWWDQIGGSYGPPADTDWRLVVGDIAALPAIGRIVEELPAGERATVVAEVFDEADRQEWVTAGDVDVRWLHGSGEGRAPSRLEEAVRTFPEPDGQGYIWMAGETRTVRATRRYLRHERRLAGERYSLTGYWLTNADDWAARFEPIAAEMEAIWTRGEAEGRDLEEIIDEYDTALDRAGL
ncbi:MAG: siderophore-interacting protein [Solirubrobacteraceae bacterium]|nr:siderophore-interacting protein [Solirubrobacteraceae bacterium]